MNASKSDYDDKFKIVQEKMMQYMSKTNESNGPIIEEPEEKIDIAEVD